MITRLTLLFAATSLTFVSACSSGVNGGGDTGTDVLTLDTAASDGDSAASPADVATDSAGDTVTTDTTSTDATSDTPSPTDSGGACTAGVECTNYAAVLAAAPRGATSLSNCVIQLHQSDCCGATRAYGINHGARTTLCPAETSCVATYPTPAGCSDATITTDTGETTTTMANVKLRIVSPMPCTFDATMTCYTCETFVCNTGSCASAPGIAGGCGG